MFINTKHIKENRLFPRSVSGKTSGLRALTALSLVSLLLFSGLACSRDSEKLATFDKGEVTRGEFRDILDIFQDPESLKKMTVEQQDEALQNISLIKIAAAKAREQKLDKEDAFKMKSTFLKEWSAIATFSYLLRKDFEKESLQMMDTQFLFLRKSNLMDPHSAMAGKDPGTQDRTSEAREMLAKLNSGLSDHEIARYISENTEVSGNKATGGYMEPLCYSCKLNQYSFLTDRLLKADRNKFILIADDPTGYWIVRKLKDYKTGPDDLKTAYVEFLTKSIDYARSYFKEVKKGEELEQHLQGLPDAKKIETIAKERAASTIRRNSRSLLSETIKEMQKNQKLLYTTAAEIPGTNPFRKAETLNPSNYDENTLLFTLNGKKFTFGDLDNYYKEAGLDHPLEQKLMALHRLIVPYKLIQNSGKMKEITESNAYDIIYRQQIDQVLASMYIEMNQPKVNITDEDLQQLYSVRKNNQYKGKSFTEVKDQILREVQRVKQHSNMKEYRDSLLKNAHLKINRELLKAGSI